MKVALRIDVDTLRGTRVGVPNLLRILKQHNIRATFFFSVGPDNMGRHLWRLIRPKFLIKMLRTRAASLYGWDILLRGTLWPGPLIGKAAADVIRAAAADGHEIGLHAWDHHRWQMRIDAMSREQIANELRRGYDALSGILGRAPHCSAVPGWRCNESALLEKESLGFAYNSDCRGDKLFRPRINGSVLKTPQIPVDLPTYDELVGQDGVTPENYNEHLLSLLKPDGLNVLTIHAEVEGIICQEMFVDFIRRVQSMPAHFMPLGELINSRTMLEAPLAQGTIPGREGWVAMQGQFTAGGGTSGAQT